MKKTLLILIALLLTGCVPNAWQGDPTNPHVVVIGDSLTYHAQTRPEGYTLSQELTDDGHYTWVWGQIGSTMAQGYGNYTNPNLQAEGADTLVIALGTNDAHIDPATGERLVPLEESQEALHTWLVETQDLCVRLIGVAESVYTWGLDVTGPSYNAMLAQEASLHPNAMYIPWNPLPEWTKDGTDPHLTPEGNAAYRGLITSAVASCE